MAHQYRRWRSIRERLKEKFTNREKVWNRATAVLTFPVNFSGNVKNILQTEPEPETLCHKQGCFLRLELATTLGAVIAGRVAFLFEDHP